MYALTRSQFITRVADTLIPTSFISPLSKDCQRLLTIPFGLFVTSDKVEKAIEAMVLQIESDGISNILMNRLQPRGSQDDWRNQVRNAIHSQYITLCFILDECKDNRVAWRDLHVIHQTNRYIQGIYEVLRAISVSMNKSIVIDSGYIKFRLVIPPFSHVDNYVGNDPNLIKIRDNLKTLSDHYDPDTQRILGEIARASLKFDLFNIPDMYNSDSDLIGIGDCFVHTDPKGKVYQTAVTGNATEDTFINMAFAFAYNIFQPKTAEQSNFAPSIPAVQLGDFDIKPTMDANYDWMAARGIYTYSGRDFANLLRLETLINTVITGYTINVAYDGTVKYESEAGLGAATPETMTSTVTAIPIMTGSGLIKNIPSVHSTTPEGTSFFSLVKKSASAGYDIGAKAISIVREYGVPLAHAIGDYISYRNTMTGIQEVKKTVEKPNLNVGFRGPLGFSATYSQKVPPILGSNPNASPPINKGKSTFIQRAKSLRGKFGKRSSKGQNTGTGEMAD